MPRSAAAHTRSAFQSSTATALIGSAVRPGVRSIQFVPPLSERNKRPTPRELLVAQIRPDPPGAAARSLITAPVRGVVSAVRADQEPAPKRVRSTRPSLRPTSTVSGSGTATAVPVPALGYPSHVHVVALSRDTYSACMA